MVESSLSGVTFSLDNNIFFEFLLCRQIFRISPAGQVSIVAGELGDPGGIVLDREGALYVAETALHRIIRISGAGAR